MNHSRALRCRWIAPKTACGKLYAHLPRAETVDDKTKISCPECASHVYVRLEFPEDWNGVLKILGRDLFADPTTLLLQGHYWHMGAEADTALLVQVPRKVLEAQDAHPAVRMFLADRSGEPINEPEPSFVG